MFADRALEFFDHSGLESRDAAVRHHQSIRLEMRLISKADEMRDEPKAALVTLQLSQRT